MTIRAWLRWDVVQRLIPTDASGALLEIGAGQGSAGALLSDTFEYLGLEPDETSFEVAARRIGCRGRVLRLPIEELEVSHPFDIVCAFEVLEHIEDDATALNHWLSFLRPGGWLLLSVPADRHRFGDGDVRVGHFRRYDRSNLVDLLSGAGLVDVGVHRYGFPLSYVLDAARGLIARIDPESTSAERTATSGRWLQPSERFAPLTRILSLPFRFIQRPFEQSRLGTGFVARARKPAASGEDGSS